MSKLNRMLSLVLAIAMIAACSCFAVAEEEPVTLSCYIDYTWFPIDTWEGIIPQAITEATGVQMDVTVATDSSQLGLMIASGDLPDLIYVWYNSGNSVSLMSDDLCYAYEDLVEEYCPDWNIEEEFGAQIDTMRALSPDGKYYTLLDGFESEAAWAASYGVPIFGNLYYRKDLLDAMGLEAPETVDDVLNMFAKAKETYPDRVTCGLIPTHFIGVFQLWAGMPGSVNGFVIQNDGTAVYQINHEQYYDSMKFVNSLYREGYFMDENFVYTDENDTFKLMSEDKLFSMTHCATNNYNVMNDYNRQSNPDAEWYPCGAMPSEAEVQAASGGGWTATYITKNCKNPEAAIKLMRYLYTDGLMTSLCGREGIDWWYDENGEVVLSDELIASYTAEGSDSYINKYQWRYAFGVSAPQQSLVGDYIAAGDEQMQTINKSLKVLYKQYDELNYVSLDPDSDESVIKTKLDEYISSAGKRMIMAQTDEEFDDIYNTMMADCEKIGVARLEETVNAQIREGMANK